jgi:S-adenosylmethionine hydrolase
MKNPIVTLLTDFGTKDNFVGSMKGVVLGICPNAQLVDLTHEVPPQDITTGAFLLKTSMAYFPKGTVHLAVVDPGVGSARKAIAVKSRGQYFVGPDNGLFAAALRDWGFEAAVELTEKKYHLPKRSQTFHGRDLFSPVAAHLAKGVLFSKLGKSLDQLVPGTLPLPRPIKEGFEGEVLWIDHFGNLVTNFGNRTLSVSFRLKIGKKIIAKVGQHYAQVKKGELVVLGGSSGYLEVSVNQGRADALLKAKIGDKVSVIL